MTVLPGDHVRIQVESDPRHLRLVREAVESFARAAGLDEDRTRGLVAAVDEACANVVRHAYGGDASGRLEVLARRVDAGPGGGRAFLEVRVLDWGLPPPPGCGSESGLPAEPPPPDALRAGGLGLKLMRHHVDDLTFLREPAGANCVRLAVRLDAPQEPGGPG